MNKSKLKILVPLVLVLLGGAYKFVLAKPDHAAAEPKVKGSVYVLGKEFLVNLADGRFAKLTVGLVLDPHDTSTAPAEGGHGAAPPEPPEGFGPMGQEALVRDLVTDALTDARDVELIHREGREKLKREILKEIKRKTDVHAEEVLFTDVTVQ